MVLCSQSRTRTGYRARRSRQPYDSIVSPSVGSYWSWGFGYRTSLRPSDYIDFRSTLFFASLWYSPWLVKPDRAFPYQKSHMKYHLTSHHIGHTIRWWAETCSQDRIRTCFVFAIKSQPYCYSTLGRWFQPMDSWPFLKTQHHSDGYLLPCHNLCLQSG